MSNMWNVLEGIVTMLMDAVLVALIALTNAMTDLINFGDSFLLTYYKLLFAVDDDGVSGLYMLGETSFLGERVNLIYAMQGIGISLLSAIYLIHLIKSMFYNLNSQGAIEHPMNILKRALFYGAILAIYPMLVTAIFRGVFSPLNEPVKSLDIKLDILNILEAGIGTPPESFGELLVNAIGGLALSVISSVVKLIGMLFLVFHFFRLLLEMVERFLQVFFLTLFGPICIACGASPVLFEISYRWFIVWLNSGIMCIVNVFMSKLSLIAIYNFLQTYPDIAVDGSLGRMLVRFILTYATIRIGYTMDNYLSQMDVPILRAGGFENPLMGSKLLEAAIKN